MAIKWQCTNVSFPSSKMVYRVEARRVALDSFLKGLVAALNSGSEGDGTADFLRSSVGSFLHVPVPPARGGSEVSQATTEPQSAEQATEAVQRDSQNGSV